VREETAVARRAPTADTNVRVCTAGDANWRPNGLRRALEKVLEAILMMWSGEGSKDSSWMSRNWGAGGFMLHRLSVLWPGTRFDFFLFASCCY